MSTPRRSLPDIRASKAQDDKTLLRAWTSPNLHEPTSSADESTVPKRTRSTTVDIDTSIETFSANPSNTNGSSASTSPASSEPGSLSLSTMKTTVTIDYSSRGLKPPVFVSTSLTEPQWEPIEMHFDRVEHGEYYFYRTFEAEEGEYQYKLRLGPGDWWVCDDSKPIVNDEAGNKNNILEVTLEDSERPDDYVDADSNSPTYGRVMDGVHHIPLFQHETEMPAVQKQDSEHHDGDTADDFDVKPRQGAESLSEGRSSACDYQRSSSPASRRSSYQDPCPEEVMLYGNTPLAPEEERERDSLALYRHSFKLCPPSDKAEGPLCHPSRARSSQYLPSVLEDEEDEEDARADSIAGEAEDKINISEPTIDAVDQTAKSPKMPYKDDGKAHPKALVSPMILALVSVVAVATSIWYSEYSAGKHMIDD